MQTYKDAVLRMGLDLVVSQATGLQANRMFATRIVVTGVLKGSVKAHR